MSSAENHCPRHAWKRDRFGRHCLHCGERQDYQEHDEVSSAGNDTRPVWLTRSQRNTLDIVAAFDEAHADISRIVAAWDAAPADPAEALRLVLRDWAGYPGEMDDAPDELLAALGAPYAR